MQVTVELPDGSDRIVELEGKPETCPHCRKRVDVRRREGFYVQGEADYEVHLVYRCPSVDCGRPFIAAYEKAGRNEFVLARTYP